MTTDWAHAATPMLAAFAASLVEAVEALTVVLAVGAVRGWRGALGGTGLALAVLLALVPLLGPALASLPVHLLRLGFGTLTLLFGMRWLRKAMLRSARIIPLRDEDAVYARSVASLRAQGRGPGWDRVAMGTAFQIVIVEGTEVVFIVLAVGATGGALVPAGLGAFAALVLVAGTGLLLHRPVARVPENVLKFAVGVLLSGFGAFWVGEGAGLDWPGGDWSIPVALGVFLGAALAGVRLCRRVVSA